jgi:hypothetical protein
MKNIFSLLAILAAFLFQHACSTDIGFMYDRYACTVTKSDMGANQAAPFTLFVTITPASIEFNGQVTEYEVKDISEDAVSLSTNMVLNEWITVRQITYDRAGERLILEVDGSDHALMLDKYDHLMERKVNEFAAVSLKADITHLSGNQREMLSILFEVASIMDDIYWMQACPGKETILQQIDNEHALEFFMINYGPWERLNGNLSFIPGVGLKPAGSGFYPSDMTREEFNALEAQGKEDLYTLIKRTGEGLDVVPYHEAYSEKVSKAAMLLLEAADLAEDPGFEKYLRLRSQALLTDDYFASDLAWMDMKTNTIDFVVGPIENYEDNLFNYKAAHEAFILLKDKEWSQKLAFISSLLPQLQTELPVDPEYKKEVPGSSSDLGAYDVVYYAGDCNAGSKTIAINLPNDERVHAAKGSRKLQLKNAIRYKFEEILVPISNVLIAEDQREHVKFDAFFENTMFHEVAHGLGINHTINGKGTVRSALREQYSALEEGKADILGLFLVTKLAEMGELGEKDLMDNYVTFMASIFRSVRFGVASSHGKANMIRFYYFQETGAFTRDEDTGTYRIDFDKMQQAMNDLARMILTIQGNGEYETAKTLVEEKGFIRDDLRADLNRLEDLNIPRDIRFNQGPELLGLE